MRLLSLVVLVLFLGSCEAINFADKANTKFADQHFKTAIAQIELYNKRYGHYPESLDSLTYLGDWDLMAITAVKYERLDTGYSLDADFGMVKGKPSNLNYPADFWQGLGLKKSNLLNNNPQ
ncbi:MAG: hypothetical protein KA149_02370 [Chitinophagales bacterium]|nr:hypothetical protein [Chitinophagales bacterium]